MNEQERNLKLSEQWESLYNENADRMATECYAMDAEIEAMGLSKIDGQAALREVEKVVDKAAPKRFMRVTQRHTCGNTVIVESVLYDPDKGEAWNIPFVAVLTCKDGKIVSDRTYANWAEWPGIG
ncbi:MAG: nuclear transport factor 2 family protein [Proteobacteria bacterium]|nr:nuclear transport factor 2 family protein [Pseudomonadota bacterium]